MPTPSPDRAARARELLAARARRASNLRRRAVAGALAGFALAWGVIAFHGPMGEAGTTASTGTTATTSTSSSADTSTAGSSTTSGSASDDSSSSDAVVTAQS